MVRATAIYDPNMEGLKGRATGKKAVPITVSQRVTDEQIIFVDILSLVDLHS